MSENGIATRVIVMMACMGVVIKAAILGLNVMLPHDAVEFGCARCLVNKMLPAIIAPVVGFVFWVGIKDMPMRLPGRKHVEPAWPRKQLWRGRLAAARKRLGREPKPMEVGK